MHARLAVIQVDLPTVNPRSADNSGDFKRVARPKHQGCTHSRRNSSIVGAYAGQLSRDSGHTFERLIHIKTMTNSAPAL